MNPWRNHDFGCIIPRLRDMTATYAHNTLIEEERSQQRNSQHQINQHQSFEIPETSTRNHENIRQNVNQIDLQHPPQHFSYARTSGENLTRPMIVNNKSHNVRLQPTRKKSSIKFFQHSNYSGF